MAVFQLGDDVPQLGAGAWVADNATVIGKVSLGEDASVWYGCILRGDNDRITIGRASNVQDGSVLHIDGGVPLTVGDGVSIGHQVMLHGCSIGDNTLIGIQSVVLNRARIGKNSIVGACSLVTEGKEFPDGVLIVGSPAKVVRPLTAQEIERLKLTSLHYVEQVRRHRDNARRID